MAKVDKVAVAPHSLISMMFAQNTYYLSYHIDHPSSPPPRNHRTDIQSHSHPTIITLSPPPHHLLPINLYGQKSRAEYSTAKSTAENTTRRKFSLDMDMDIDMDIDSARHDTTCLALACIVIQPDTAREILSSSHPTTSINQSINQLIRELFLANRACLATGASIFGGGFFWHLVLKKEFGRD